MINIDIRESVNCNGDYSCFVTFEYNSNVVEIIKQFPTRVYNAKDKSWEIPLNQLGKIACSLSDYDITITGKYVKLDDKKKLTVPADFKFKTTPYEHQIEGIEYGLNHDKWLLGDEQGLGKTKQVIDIANIRNVKHCLIICCVNGLKWNWRNEVYTHSNDGAWILGQRNKKDNLVIATNPERLADLNDIDNLPRFIITNIETLRYKVKTGKKVVKREKGRVKEVDEYIYPITDKINELCAKGEIDMIAIDEGHKCKNPDSQQAKQMLSLKSNVQIVMTGTPLMNAPLDLYVPLTWLGYEKHSFWQFKNHYCTLGGFSGTEVTGYKNLEEISDTLDTMMLRRLKDDVLDLPEKTLIDEYVEMGDEQSKVYSMAHADIKSNIDKLKMTNNPLAELIRLRQATGNPSIISDDVIDNAKFDRMEEIVDDAIENNRKVVIFSNWTQMTNPAFKRLSKKYKGVMITGETKDNVRQEYVDAFQNDNKVKFIIGTTGAMGTGLTLTAGSVEIFLDEPWNMALKEQAIDRCHRIGAKSNITIYTLLCKDTIDERIHTLVEKKGAISDILVDNAVEGDKNALINYLLS